MIDLIAPIYNITETKLILNDIKILPNDLVYA